LKQFIILIKQFTFTTVKVLPNHIKNSFKIFYKNFVFLPYIGFEQEYLKVVTGAASSIEKFLLITSMIKIV
jgi:hypothetical protein